jgi:hypothetical protein
LQALITRGALPVDQVVRYAKEIAEAFYESDCQGQISPSTTKSLSLQSAPNFDRARVCVWIAAFNSCQIENVFSALRFFWCEP